MKQITRRVFGWLCVLALVMSMVSVGAVWVSADTVVPRSVQLQWLTEWKDDYYGGGNLYDTGCGIFAIVNAVGYVTGNEMSVTEVAQWAHDIGGYNPGSASSGTLRYELYPYLEAKYGEDYGFTVDHNGGQGYWQSASSSTLKKHLLNGGVAIGHVYGHFIAVVGYDSSTGYFHVYDSAPSTARGTGNGDAWVSESWFTTSSKLTLDWFVLVTGTGNPINLDYGAPRTGTTAQMIGTYRLNSNAPSTDPLNVRTAAGTSYDIVGTVQEGDLVYVSELSDKWGKLKKMDGSVEGWASISSYADYIGVDVLGGTGEAAWGSFTSSIDENGQFTIVNHSTTETVGYDFRLPIAIGTNTTPYMSLQITPNYGDGYYFGITEYGSGYIMMRDCSSGDEMVLENSAPYMSSTETLEIDMREWWKPTEGYRIDTVRLYVAPASSITINYFYFAAESGVVTDTTYNLVRNTTTALNETLMLPDTLSVVDRTKNGSYTYNNGMLTVVSGEEDGYAVSFEINKEFSPETLHRLLYSVEADVRYDIEFVLTTSDGDKSVSLVSDFWPEVCTALDGGYIPAAAQSVGLNLKNVYVYNQLMPADGVSTIKTVTVKAGGKGTVIVNAIQIANNDDLLTYQDGVSRYDSTPDAEGIRGDVTGDGVTNTTDVRRVLRYTVGGEILTDAQLALADCNGDGVVDTADARSMLKLIA